MNRHLTVKGFGLIEIIVALGIISISLLSLALATHGALVATNENAREGKALFLIEEGVEAVKIIRDTSWSSQIAPLTAGTPYYLVFTSTWTLSSINPGPIDGVFTRTVRFQDVYRRTVDDDLVDVSSLESKVLDQGTKKVTVSVSWNSPNGTKTRSISTYLANIFQN